ncbi:MAG TPA: hypothetical protein VLE49_09885 [Anaerolineales bacterium]|nr:hypothetical protein [Anaerolineales bacterium]
MPIAELLAVHVRQFKDDGWRFAIFVVQRAMLKDKWKKLWGEPWNIYQEVPHEKEAAGCQAAFNADPTIPLDSAPCLIVGP